MILDASFLIDLMGDDPGAVAKLDELAGDPLSIPTLIYTEVGTGLPPGSSAERAFEEAVGAVSIVPYHLEAAKRAVDIQRTLLERGTPIGAVDVMVAGTAVARDEPIVTRNVEAFARTPARLSPY